jgi:hypothetical protein
MVHKVILSLRLRLALSYPRQVKYQSKSPICLMKRKEKRSLMKLQLLVSSFVLVMKQFRSMGGRRGSLGFMCSQGVEMGLRVGSWMGLDRLMQTSGTLWLVCCLLGQGTISTMHSTCLVRFLVFYGCKRLGSGLFSILRPFLAYLENVKFLGFNSPGSGLNPILSLFLESTPFPTISELTIE